MRERRGNLGVIKKCKTDIRDCQIRWPVEMKTCGFIINQLKRLRIHAIIYCIQLQTIISSTSKCSGKCEMCL